MKKEKAGMLLTVITPNEKIYSIIEYIHTNTTISDLRMHSAQIKIMKR